MPQTGASHDRVGLSQPTSRSLWLQGDRPSFPRYDGTGEVDVAVVGAGISGLTTAVLLARAGCRVTVLEGAQVAGGTTGGSTAKVSALQGSRYRTLTQDHGPDAAARYASAQVAGLGWMAEQVETRRVDCGWERQTAFTYATDDDSEQTVRQEHAAASAAGLAVRLCDDVAVPHARSAVALDDQAQFDPVPYLDALAAEVDRTSGCSVFERSRVVTVRGHRNPKVVTDSGSLRAGHVVVATLLPITDRGLFFARSEPKASYTIAVRTHRPLPPGMYLSASSPTRSLRRVRHGDESLVLVGGNGHTVGRKQPTSACYDDLVSWAQSNLGATEVVARWYAHDYVPVDHLPWVGAASPGSPNVLVAGGFEKWGITGGTAAGIALADRILGRTEGPSASWASLFEPTRIDPRSLVSGLRANAEVGAQMVAGWANPKSPARAPGDGNRYRAGLTPHGTAGSGPDRTVGSVVCTHLGGPCSWNDAEHTWDCPLHGSRFRADGTVLTGPATTALHRQSAPADE